MAGIFTEAQLNQIAVVVQQVIGESVTTPVADNKANVQYDSKASEQLDQIEADLQEQLKTEAPMFIRGRRGGEWFFPSEQKLNIIMNLRKERKSYRDGVHKV